MDQAWLRGLTDRGARIENDRVSAFSSPTRAAANAIQVVPLLDEGIILTTGEDALEFLQGQLTNDVAEVSASRGQLAAYCTPKGRVLATLLIWPWDDGYALQLPRELAAPICQRLRMYVLRSRVKLELIGDRLALIGVIGKGAAAVVQTPLGLLSEQPYAAAANDGITAVSLPGERWQLATEVGSALATWDRLSRLAAPAGQDAWARKGIDAGVPTITAATSDRFVPQMLNLDLVAGVSFSKGCYPGQEIVARAQYRGQVKRRLERFRIAGPATPGAAIYSEGQEVGTVVNAVADSADHFVALAVVSTTADARTLTLAASGGPALEPLGVPYAVPGAQPSMSDVG